MEGLDFFSQYKLNVQPGSRIYLCRNDCRKEDILVETQRESMQTGRYRIRYDKTDNKVHVVITDLILSDTGSYKVGVGEYSPGSYKEFKIKVRGKFHLKIILSVETETFCRRGSRVHYIT